MKILRAKNQTGRVVTIRLKYLYPIVDADVSVLKSLRDSIDKEGMRDPIIVSDITIYDWLNDPNPDIFPPPDKGLEEHVYRVQRGHNRLEYAKEMGYDAIDCLVFNDIQTASMVGEEIRKKNKGWNDV